MEDQHPAFNFKLQYAGNAVDCKVIMQAQSYDVQFDGRFMASIAHTGEMTWIQESGIILPDSIIDEIGFHIESEYK